MKPTCGLPPEVLLFSYRRTRLILGRSAETTAPCPVHSTADARACLIQMLNEADFDLRKPNPPIALGVLRRFATVQFDCADDAFLFQCGVYDFTGRDEYQLDFVRQFSFEENGEYDRMEQLRCTIYFEPDPELRALESNLWSYDCASVSEFFEQASKMPGYTTAVEGRVPTRAEIAQEQV